MPMPESERRTGMVLVASSLFIEMSGGLKQTGIGISSPCPFKDLDGTLVPKGIRKSSWEVKRHLWPVEGSQGLEFPSTKGSNP